MAEPGSPEQGPAKRTREDENTDPADSQHSSLSTSQHDRLTDTDRLDWARGAVGSGSDDETDAEKVSGDGASSDEGAEPEYGLGARAGSSGGADVLMAIARVRPCARRTSNSGNTRRPVSRMRRSLLPIAF